VLFTLSPKASRIATTGWVRKATSALAVLDGCVVITRWVAVPGPTAIVLLAGEVKPRSMKLRVRSLVTQSILRLVNVATRAARR
jgi:hypothetical protein